MKSLNKFINELKLSNNLQQEEKRINIELSLIKSKLSSSISILNKRKYLINLIYIHLLNYNINFGYSLILDLFNTSSYPDKYLAYLAFDLLYDNIRSGSANTELDNSATKLAVSVGAFSDRSAVGAGVGAFSDRSVGAGVGSFSDRSAETGAFNRSSGAESGAFNRSSGAETGAFRSSEAETGAFNSRSPTRASSSLSNSVNNTFSPLNHPNTFPPLNSNNSSFSNSLHLDNLSFKSNKSHSRENSPRKSFTGFGLFNDDDKKNDNEDNSKSFFQDFQIVPYLFTDLQSDNEDFNCLALNFICSHFNGIEIESGDYLIDIVYGNVISPLSSPLIKKKASLALFTLIKVYPELISPSWIPRLLALLDYNNLGVVISSIPLIEFILKLNPEFIISIIPSITTRLYTLIIDQVCPQEYYYHDCPAPWLVIKLLNLLETFSLIDPKTNIPYLSVTDLNESNLNQLRQIVSKSIQIASKPAKGLPNRNIQLAILFQAVNLTVFLNASSEAIDGAIIALLSLLNAADTNTKYLSLNALIKLVSKSSIIFNFNDYFDQIFELLYDRDISIRRKTLDFVVGICNPDNHTIVIGKLLNYFPTSDFQLKQDLAVKISILTENFAQDSTWYVATMLKLLSIGGGFNSNGTGYISDEVWERIVTIIINNADLQPKSCKLIISLLKSSSTNNLESLVKVASLILGEYGDQVSKEYNVKLQFQLLYKSYFGVSLTTRSMLLSTFLKFLVKFPDEDFQFDIVDLFEAETSSIDLEIQTRAYEYLQLATIKENFALAKEIVKPLPFYSQKETSLMKRIGMNNNHISRRRSLVLDKVIQPRQPKINLSSNWYPGFLRMLHYDAGIFYENQLIKLTYRFIKDGFNIKLVLTVINNSLKTLGNHITGFKVLSLETGADKENPPYIINIDQSPEPSFTSKTSIELGIKVRNIVEFKQNPVISFTFTSGGSFNQLSLKIPVVLIKTISSTSSPTVDEFKRRWLQIGEQLGLEKGEYVSQIIAGHRSNSSNVVRLLNRCGFAVVFSTQDSIEDLLVLGTGIIHTQSSNYGILVSLKSKDGKSFDLNVRSTGVGVAEIVSLELKEVLEANV